MIYCYLRNQAHDIIICEEYIQMDYSSSREKNTVTVEFTATEEEFKSAEMKAYQTGKGKYNVPGFRKGKAPKHVIEQMYGPVFFEDAIDVIVQSGYEKYLENSKDGYPIDKPALNMKSYDTKKLEWSVSFTVMPDVELCDYKSVTIPKIEHKVTDEDVEAELKRVQDRNSRMEDVETAENGDTVNLDYSGSVDGEKFEGGTAEKQNLVLGSGTFIPGFEDQLVGVKAGDEKDINVKFPDDYHADNLKGKDAVFACKINKITRKILPELDDSFAQDVSDCDTMDAYKAQLRADLEKKAADRTKSEKEDAIINAIAKASIADIPECLIDDTLEEMLEEFSQRLSYQGLKIDDYFKYTGTTKEKYKEDTRETAVKRIMSRLCMSKIVKEEGIEATDEEAAAKYREQMAKYGSKEEIKDIGEKELEYMKESVVMDKLFDMLIASCKEEEQPEEEPVQKPAKKASSKKKTENA